MARPEVEQQQAQRVDERWAMDFVSDWCVGVKRVLRVLTMVDCFTRESLALKAIAVTGPQAKRNPAG